MVMEVFSRTHATIRVTDYLGATMKKCILCKVVYVMIIVGFCQGAAMAKDGQAPRNVVGKYMALEVGGARLSPEGLAKLKKLSTAPIVPEVAVKSSVIASWSILGETTSGDSAKVEIRLNFIGRIEDFSYFTAEPGSRVKNIELVRANGSWKVVTELGSILNWRTVVEQRGPKWAKMRKAVYEAASHSLPSDKKQAAAVEKLIRNHFGATIKPASSVEPASKWELLTGLFSGDRSKEKVLLTDGFQVQAPILSKDKASSLVLLSVKGERSDGEWNPVAYQEALLVDLHKEDGKWKVERVERHNPLVRN
jgi:hypothetical protein